MHIPREHTDSIWKRSSTSIGRPPHEIVAAAARFLGGEVDKVHAEALVEGGNTEWRILWLEGSILGIATATANVPNWNSDSVPDAQEPKVIVVLRPLSTCDLISYSQRDVQPVQWGSGGFHGEGGINLYFGEDLITLNAAEWTTSNDPDRHQEFKSELCSRWLDLMGRGKPSLD